jgi:CRP-like cAMP-binding protein
MTMGFSAFLKSLDVFSDLNDQERFILVENAQGIEYALDAVIVKRGEIGRFLWIVQEGEVKVILPPSESAAEITILLKTGALFGEMSIRNRLQADQALEGSRFATDRRKSQNPGKICPADHGADD